MQIYINKSTSQTPNWKLAALKKGTSFEYVSENRLFSGSDGYTLTITFPLKDCPQNQAIFGHINRADVAVQKVIFDCEIRDKGFYKFGCITITEINESEVKTQFLDGRSEQNFDKTLDKIYINELNLGEPPTTAKTAITPANAWLGLAFGNNGVALPWVNDASGNIQNCTTYTANTNGQPGGTFSWHTDTKGLSWQPYLLYITKKICEQIGYSYDFSDWEAKEEYKYLLICNTLPYSWYIPQYARALPHWSVEEYFAKLELFMGCEFNFDHRAQRITFAFTKSIVNAKPAVRLDKIVEEHSTEVKVENDHCEYSEAKNLAYKECSHQMYKYYSCDWFIRGWQSNVQRYNTLNELLTANRGYASWDGRGGRGSNMNKLLYAANVDTYFIIRTVSRVQNGYMGDGRTKRWIYKCVLQPVNSLGPRIVDDSDEAQTDEIEFVPACIDYTDDTYGFAMFLSADGFDEETTSFRGGRTGPEPFSDAWYEERNSRFTQSQPAQSLAAGEKTKKAEYYDKIYIAWWDGAGDGSSTPPHPHVENLVVRPDWSGYYHPHFSIRLNDSLDQRFHIALPIEPTKKTTFKFLANKVPDVRAPFIIRGKRYVCEKLTATFTENGMSQLIKGVFYPVPES